jgi:glycogen debranching enzyme
MDESRQARKQRVLTHGMPSVTRAIARAVVLKSGDVFLITGRDGSVPCSADHGLGLYYHDCRFVSGYELRVNGMPPVGLGAGASAGCRGTIRLTNPEMPRSAGDIPRDTIGIDWSRTLDGEALALDDTITFHNWGREPRTLTVELRFAAGFEDVFQVRGLLGERLGQAEPPSWDGTTLRFLYHGRDELDRSVEITLPSELRPTGRASAAATVELAPRQSRALELRVGIAEVPRGGARASSRRPHTAPERRSAGAWPDGIATVASDSIALDGIMTRSFADLDLLRTTLRERSFIAAGIPWFATLFGRDSLIAALQLLPYTAHVAADTLRLLASYQGDRTDQWRDEEPGKILHSLRVGEMARTGEIPHNPYYGSVDATPLFLMVLSEYVAWTGDLALVDELADNVRRALEWIDGPADRDGDGYVEYRSESEHGLINQGWKDSGDAIVDAVGAIATPPIALVEVQAYVYAAKRGVAGLYAARGDVAGAERLRQEAGALRDRFERDFWSDSLGCYVMALEADKQPLEVISSNPGHALWCGIAAPDRAAVVSRRLLADDMYSGWGVRTLSAKACAFSPIGYHLGTVWPHDSAIAAAGFKRYGFADEACRVFEGLAEAALDFEHRRLPELFTGYARRSDGEPVRYPVACHPQAWAAGALPFLLSRLLGLAPDALGKRLRIVEPVLPRFAESLELRGLRVGDASADLRFERARREGASARVEVIGRRGDLDIVVEERRQL